MFTGKIKTVFDKLALEMEELQEIGNISLY